LDAEIALEAIQQLGREDRWQDHVRRNQVHTARAEVGPSELAGLEVEAQSGDLYGTQVDINPVEVALKDQVRDLPGSLQPFFSVHLDEEVKGPGQEMAAAACRVKEGHIAEAVRQLRILSARIPFMRAGEIAPVVRELSARGHIHP
jgi:predicted transcriptional regulator